MIPLKVAVSLTSFAQPLRQALQSASQLGITAVEIDAREQLKPAELTDTAARQIRKMLEDLNLSVSSVRFQTRFGYHVQENLDGRVQATKAALQMAYRLGASVVTNQIGRIPDESDPARGLLVEVLADLAHFSNSTGAWLAARTGTESGKELQGLLDQLPPGGIQVSLDPGALAAAGFDANEAVEVLGSQIVHVYAKDGTRDLAVGRGLQVPLGRGTVDFPQLIAQLEDCGYRNYLTIERDDPRDPIGEVKQAFEFLRNIYQS